MRVTHRVIKSIPRCGVGRLIDDFGETHRSRGFLGMQSDGQVVGCIDM
jgi:hypothetical protein